MGLSLTALVEEVHGHGSDRTSDLAGLLGNNS